MADESTREADDTVVVRFLTGSVYIPFEENYRITLDNLLNGRPLHEGLLPNRIIPDPRFSPNG